MDTLYDLTKKVIKLSMEKRLKDSLFEVAPELPNEILDDIYNNLYRPVMINVMKILHKVIWK